MKLKTCKHTCYSRNILGDLFVSDTYYVIYKTTFFGLCRRYLRIIDSINYCHWYKSFCMATRYHSQAEAEAAIEDIEANPNRYVLR